MTVIENIRMVTAMLEELDGSPPITKDLREGFPRPCTYIEPTSTELTGGAGGEEITEETDIRITYFGEETDTGYIDLLKFQNALSERLSMPIIGDNFVVYPDGVSFDLDRDEMVLECEFSIITKQTISRDNDTIPLMDTLKDKEV